MNRMGNFVANHFNKILDRLFRSIDVTRILRTMNLRLIPDMDHRRGGKHAYAEWAHVIGLFQALIYQNLGKQDANVILDIGCGTGLLAIASEPFLAGNSRYIGIDVGREDIEFCRKHYESPVFEFRHFDISNPAYAPDQQKTRRSWPLMDSSVDLVTALSVWTHLNEQDALFYMKEVSRVLRPGGKAIITFFVLDQTYRNTLGERADAPGRFHMTNQRDWIFDHAAYGSRKWFYPEWAPVAESAIGITEDGMADLLAISGLEIVVNYPGNWKELPGLYFQDVVILQKPSA